MGAGVAGAPSNEVKNQLSEGKKNCQKREEVRGRGEVGRGWAGRGWGHAGEACGRDAWRALGVGLLTALASRLSARRACTSNMEPSAPPAVPPRGVEPRTLPTIRPTGRPGQRLFSNRK